MADEQESESRNEEIPDEIPDSRKTGGFFWERSADIKKYETHSYTHNSMQSVIQVNIVISTKLLYINIVIIIIIIYKLNKLFK